MIVLGEMDALKGVVLAKPADRSEELGITLHLSLMIARRDPRV